MMPVRVTRVLPVPVLDIVCHALHSCFQPPHTRFHCRYSQQYSFELLMKSLSANIWNARELFSLQPRLLTDSDLVVQELEEPSTAVAPYIGSLHKWMGSSGWVTKCFATLCITLSTPTLLHSTPSSLLVDLAHPAIHVVPSTSAFPQVILGHAGCLCGRT